MKLDECIQNRKSIRSYQKTEVPKEDIEKIISAAQLAPTWKNFQTTRFYVVCSEDKVQEMKKHGLSSFNAQRTENVDVYVVVTFKKDISGFDEEKNPVNEMGQGWGYYDAGIVSNQLILKACDLGYGTLIMGIRNEQAIRTMLEIPDDEIITSVISLGKSKDVPTRNPRKPLDEVLCFK